MIRMPGESWHGPLPEMTPSQVRLRQRLQRDVRVLAADIGERNTRRYDSLREAAEFIDRRFREAGYGVAHHPYSIRGRSYENLEVQLPGRGEEGPLVIVGAHYDSAIGSPGANDNGTGVAALLAVAERLAGRTLDRPVRLVAFTNEEMPHFQDRTMGSLSYARGLRDRDVHVRAMLSLETIGYYSEQPGSQQYPFPVGLVYPSRGNFIGFVGNLDSRGLVREAVGGFRHHARFPSEGAALPGWMPGVGWSDHASFWEYGYPGVMVTDTAPFRYPYYHTAGDTPDKIDFDRLARVVDGLVDTVVRLADADGGS